MVEMADRKLFYDDPKHSASQATHFMPDKLRTASLTRTKVIFSGLGAVLLFSLVACDGGPKAAPSKKPKRVEVMTVSAETFQETIIASGVARAKTEHRISSEISGLLKAQHAERGDYVKKGKALFKIDPEPFQLRLKERNARLSGARAHLQFARAEMERKQSLFKEGTLSQSAWERLKLDAASAEAERDQAIVAHNQAKRDLRLTTFRSPIDGLVLERHHELGAVLPAGALLASVADLSEMVFEVGVSDLELGDLHKKDRIKIMIDAFPEKKFEGKITQISANAAPDKGTFPVEISLENPRGEILPGMVGRLTLPGAVHEDRFIIPLMAVHQEASESIVYLVEKDRVLKRKVKIGKILGDRLVIEEGIVAGEQLVLISHGRLKAGEKVEVVGP